MSRIGEYAERLQNENRSAGQVSDLEAQIEDAERSTFRLYRQLSEETAGRARAERVRDDAIGELEEAKQKIVELEEKINESSRRKPRTRKSRTGTSSSRKVPGSSQRVDGGTPHERSGGAESADSSGDASPNGSSGQRKSARVRGGVN